MLVCSAGVLPTCQSNQVALLQILLEACMNGRCLSPVHEDEIAADAFYRDLDNACILSLHSLRLLTAAADRASALRQWALSHLRIALEWATVPLFVIALQLPQGAVLYWAASSSFALLQVRQGGTPYIASQGMLPALVARTCCCSPAGPSFLTETCCCSKLAAYRLPRALRGRLPH